MQGALKHLVCLRRPKRARFTGSKANSSVPDRDHGKEIQPCSLAQSQCLQQKTEPQTLRRVSQFEFQEDEAEGWCWAQAMFSVQRKEGRTAQLRLKKKANAASKAAAELPSINI